MFADAEIVGLLRAKFVTVAVDEWYQHRQKDAEGEFYRKVAHQGPRNKPNETTQGLYAFTADGTLVGYTNHRSADRVKPLLKKALEAAADVEAPAVERGKADARFERTLPEGAAVVDVTSKVLGGYGEPKTAWEKAYQTSLGRDHLWIRRDEVLALEKGGMPESLARRMVRFHFIDNTRGEPPMWAADEVKELSLKLEGGRLAGKVRLETASGDRGFEAAVAGFVEAKDGKLARFDVVAKGQFRGEGRYTQNAPEGRFPFAVGFALADPGDAASKVPPQGARDLRDYLR